MIKGILKHKLWRQVFTPLAYRCEQERIAYLNTAKAEAKEFFGKLPRCTAKVTLVSPVYYRDHPIQERHRFQPDSIVSGEVRGEIFISSLVLAHFLGDQQHDSYTWGDHEAWLAVFVDWLKDADLDDQNASMVPSAIRAKVLQNKILDLLRGDALDVFCWDCRKNYLGLIHQPSSSKLMKGWGFIEESWHCESGHLMYSFVEVMHVIGHFPRDDDVHE